MGQEKYQVLFYGELKAGHSQEMAMRALAGAYHKEDDFFASWFNTDKTIIKHEATREEAEYIRDYLAGLGLVVVIEPVAVLESAEPLSVADQQAKETEKLLEEAFKELQKTIKNVQRENVTVVKVAPASMLKRAGAFIVDMMICIILSNILLELVLAPLGIINTSLLYELSNALNGAVTQEDVRNVVNGYMANENFADLVMSVMFFAFAIQVLYFGLMDSKYRATFGKRLFKIRVYSLIGPEVLLRQAILRQTCIITAFFLLVSFLSTIGLLILLATFIMGFYDKRGLHQTIYDRITATMVGMDQGKNINP
ncbi:RDD family protein [Wohlfahrtiimonas chitiniclastica]|uniref:RDD family protein n=1 Tax=Wohlfahrtiimonas chitiniclastica TaxID=400946 RepID=UPI000B99BCF1|nr:RDD family protein [Wohlfahrtiimonas chitiniclastica]OYQ71710.1 hypothetical protein B9T13_03315 [Wohlfahrtiimonas chitiniclastica]OYQ85566.1 hypothetical protein B9T14_03510 [Wohlfahrtiimonas chitiniclastica]OYQ86198.1 hypothetical protein B9T15_01520 [Wohlfahrtiimonas chitiniclastica]